MFCTDSTTFMKIHMAVETPTIITLVFTLFSFFTSLIHVRSCTSLYSLTETLNKSCVQRDQWGLPFHNAIYK